MSHRSHIKLILWIEPSIGAQWREKKKSEFVFQRDAKSVSLAILKSLSLPSFEEIPATISIRYFLLISPQKDSPAGVL